MQSRHDDSHDDTLRGSLMLLVNAPCASLFMKWPLVIRRVSVVNYMSCLVVILRLVDDFGVGVST